MKIITLTKLNSGCDYHRITLPFRFMDLESGDRIINYNDDDVVRFSDFKGADFVIFNRLPHLKNDVLLELRDRYGFKLIMDLDDYWRLYSQHPLYDNWKKNKYGERIEKMIKEVDQVWVSTFALSGEILRHRDNCRVIGNGIPFNYEQFTPRNTETRSDIFTHFIYAGGSSHLEDLKSIKNVFDLLPSTMFRRYGTMTLAGYNSEHGENGVWENMKKVMDNCKALRVKKALPLTSYMDCYNDADVSIAPLAPYDFNKYKSNLKILEAGCKGIPIICTRMRPYESDESIEDNGILLCDNTAEWLESIKRLMSPSERIRMGKLLYNYVRTHYDIQKINKLRKADLKYVLKR